MNRRQFLKSSAKGLAVVGYSLSDFNRVSSLFSNQAWAISGSAKKLRIVFFTDVHAKPSKKISKALSGSATQINLATPDLCIAGGDLIEGGYHMSSCHSEDHWSTYCKFNNAIDREIFPALGNHDLVGVRPKKKSEESKNPREKFLKTLNLENTYYSFDACGYHFIFLDTIEITDGKLLYRGFVDQAQLEWLKEDLSKIKKATPIILTSHMPLVTSFFQVNLGALQSPPTNKVVVNNNKVLELFEKRNLILILQGHLHIDELLKWKNTTVITGGAICGNWWKGEYYGTKNGFGIIELEENKAQWRYVSRI